MSVTHQRGSASRGGLRMWQIGKAGPVGQVIQVGQARQEALSMLRLILLIIYIYSCRHECDFEKSQKKNRLSLFDGKVSDVVVVMLFRCSCCSCRGAPADFILAVSAIWGLQLLPLVLLLQLLLFLPLNLIVCRWLPLMSCSCVACIVIVCCKLSCCLLAFTCRPTGSFWCFNDKICAIDFSWVSNLLLSSAPMHSAKSCVWNTGPSVLINLKIVYASVCQIYFMWLIPTLIVKHI